MPAFIGIGCADPEETALGQLSGYDTSVSMATESGTMLRDLDP